MNPSPTVRKLKHAGLDVHAETVAVAVADSAGGVRAYGIIPAHTHAVARLIQKLAAHGAGVRGEIPDRKAFRELAGTLSR